MFKYKCNFNIEIEIKNSLDDDKWYRYVDIF